MAQTKISHPARCVVWTDASAPIAPPLARVLSARGLEPTHAASAHAALAELCLDQQAGRRPVLILDAVPDPARLLAAVERFAPDAAVWIFEPGANPPLRQVDRANAKQRSRVEIKPTPKQPAGTIPPIRQPTPAVSRNGSRPPASPQPLRLTKDPEPITTAPGTLQPTPLQHTTPALLPAPLPTPLPAPPRREPQISARDVLNDAELEMLLAGERPMEDKRR